MRGWSHMKYISQVVKYICPAYAGVILVCFFLNLHNSDLSRVCGGDPEQRRVYVYLTWFVPRMRGWSHRTIRRKRNKTICPAYAGVIPDDNGVYEFVIYLSRVCGGDPNSNFDIVSFVVFVPRMRGWSQRKLWCRGKRRTCPAYAGMILEGIRTTLNTENLSRVYGDDPWEHGKNAEAS